jgi:hypothetical protein
MSSAIHLVAASLALPEQIPEWSDDLVHGHLLLSMPFGERVLHPALSPTTHRRSV